MDSKTLLRYTCINVCVCDIILSDQYISDILCISLLLTLHLPIGVNAVNTILLLPKKKSSNLPFAPQFFFTLGFLAMFLVHVVHVLGRL
jgi:hypothetical protein